MAFTRIKPDGIFAVWGKKAYNALDKDSKKNSYYVKEDANLEGKVAAVKPSKTYGYILEIKPDDDTLVIVTGKTQLLNQLGFARYKESDPEFSDNKATNGWYKTKDAVQEGELVQINFTGLEKASNGKDMYTFDILVDRD